jgi:ABC-type molybdate transport system substrate-binding protein
VYVTDAIASDQVELVRIPEEANVPATYAGVVVKASGRLAEAHAFLDWWAGVDGQAIRADFGFLPLSP